MVGETLGTVRGQMILDVKQALNAYTAARSAHITTVTALHTGAAAMTMTGAAIAGVGIAIEAGFLTAIGAAAEFERKLDYFIAVGGPEAAGMYDEISDKALQLGADTIYSADQIADSFVELAKSGVSAKDIIDGIGEGVAALGAAADIPLDTAANIITSAVATFQLGAENAVMVADKLAGAANASIVDVEDLGISLKYAGGVAASLGVPFEDLNTALAILGVNGIKGSTAGTSLRQILLGLNGATAKAKDGLRELGIITEDGANAFYNADGSAKSLSEVFQILQDATAGMSDQQKTAVMQQIFATRALPSLIALTREGAAGFDEMAAAINKTTALDVASKRLDNLSGDLEVLRGNIDTLLISSGSGFQDFARGIVQGVTDIIQAFLDLPEGVQTTIVAIIAVIGAILIIIGFLGIFGGAIMNIIALVQIMGPVWTLLATGIRVVTGAFWAFNAALLANPIVLIIVAILAIVAALIWFFTQTELGKEIWANFTQFLTEAWNNIANLAVDVWNNVASFFSDLWNNIVGFFQAAIDWIVNAFFTWHPLGIIIANWEGIVAFFVNLWNSIIQGVVNFVTGFITFFQELPARIGAFFAALPGMIGYAIGFILGTIVRVFTAIGTWLVTNVPIIINNVITFFANLPAQIGQFFTDIWNNLIAWGVGVLTWAMTAIPQFIDFIVSTIQALPGIIGQFFADVYNNIVTWFTNAWNQAVSIASNIVSGVISFISQIPGQVANFFQQVVNNVVTFFTQAWQQAVQIGQNIFNGIRDAINGLPGLVSGIFNNVVSAVRDMVGAAFNAVADFASGLWEGFKAGLGIASPSYIEHAMWDIMDVVMAETKNLKKSVQIIQGLGNGINEVGAELGVGWGANADYGAVLDTMRANRAMQTGIVLDSTLRTDQATATELAELNRTLAEIADKDTIHIDKYETNNPVPERDSDSLPKNIRKIAFMVG